MNLETPSVTSGFGIVKLMLEAVRSVHAASVIVSEAKLRLRMLAVSPVTVRMLETYDPCISWIGGYLNLAQLA